MVVIRLARGGAKKRPGYWTGVGARMSPTVARLVKEHGQAAAQGTPAAA